MHGGLLPQWTTARARELAREVEAKLQGPDFREFILNLWGSEPTAWSDDLTGWDRLRVIVNAMTRMRFCTLDGAMEFKTKGNAGQRAGRPSALVRPARPAKRRRRAGHRPLVGARPQDHAEPAGPRFGLPVGRPPDRGAAGRPPGIPGRLLGQAKRGRGASRTARAAAAYQGNAPNSRAVALADFLAARLVVLAAAVGDLDRAHQRPPGGRCFPSPCRWRCRRAGRRDRRRRSRSGRAVRRR